jgi:hypothetical protein
MVGEMLMQHPEWEPPRQPTAPEAQRLWGAGRMRGGEIFARDRRENARTVARMRGLGRRKKTQPGDESQFTNSSTHPQLEPCDKHGTFRRKKKTTPTRKEIHMAKKASKPAKKTAAKKKTAKKK